MPAKDMEITGEPEPQVAGDPAAGTSERAETGEIEKIPAQIQEELSQAQEKVLRLAAELENTRKRLEREKSESICYANESIMREFLPVIDNLERAIEHGEKEEGCGGLLEGVRMTLKGLLDAFAKFGGARFESVGQPFDPNLHEAVTQEVTSEFPDMTVTREFQRGYTLRDRLLRPAMVSVARNPKASGPEAEE